MELLAALAERLDAATTRPIEVRIVGGAAIAAGYNPDRGVTDDVDCLETNDINAVYAAAAAVAAEHDLDDDWVNFRVRQFAPDPMYPAPEWTVLIERGDARVLVGNPRLLLAMKIKANRPNRDFGDVETLLGVCGMTTYDEARACFEEHYTTEPVPTRAAAFLRSKLADAR